MRNPPEQSMSPREAVATGAPRTILGVLAGLANKLAGPVFTKELRVASRRRRHYALRFVYLGLLTIFIAIVWLSTVRESTQAAYTSYRSAEVGKAVIATVAWFQFVALQLLAVVLMSNSISDELYHGTLGVLMTTPISNFQLVMGKLTSKMLQLVMLVIMSIPLLAIVRVLGGVPWGFVVASSCVTLTAAAVAGSISLFYSILFRRAYAAILLSLGTLFFFYMVLPLILGLVAMLATLATKSATTAMTVLTSLHPTGAMVALTMELTSPGAMGGATIFWPIHCLLMLGLSLGLLAICVPMVRKVSLRKAFSGSERSPRPPQAAPVLPPPPPPPIPPATATGVQPPPLPVAAETISLAPRKRSRRPADAIEEVTGQPVIWKETRGSLILRNTGTNVVLLLAVILIVVIDVLVAGLGGLDSPYFHASYVVTFVVIGIVVTSVLSATTISSEKESRALPILLTTTLTDWQIIWGKFVGVVRRSFPAWVLLGAHLAVFTLVPLVWTLSGARLEGFIHPRAIVQLAIILAWVVWLHICTGLYFGSRLKRTTPAVVANLGFVVVMWLLAPWVISFVGAALDSYDLMKFLGGGNPVFQAAIVMSEGGWKDNAPSYDPLGGTWAEATFFLLAWAAFYFGIGALFLWRAKQNLRKRVF